MTKYKFISDEKDYRHLDDKDRYIKLYEEVGTVAANLKIEWRSEWMKYFNPKLDSTILELGSHNGPNLLKYARDGFQIDGVELSQTLIETFKKNLGNEPEEVRRRINLYKSWIEDFKIDKRYDYVLVTEILEHVKDPIEILKVAKKHLNKNGLVYISSPSTHWGNNTHVRGVPKNSLLIWLEKSELSSIEIWEEGGRTFCISREKTKEKIYGLLRVRNEQLIIEDTLDHLDRFCTGGIFVYDDCSTDSTPTICEKYPSVRKVIRGENWDTERARAEFENRAAVLFEAKKNANENDWFVYIDADERIDYDWANLYYLNNDVIGIRMRLFDFYITPQDVGETYYNRKYIGPEYRDILIAFRNLPTLQYSQMDQREVILGTDGKVLCEGYVRHYGKAVSIEEWEKTCDYYSDHFPMYSEKWRKRKGKAIHYKYSDFGNELITWEERNEKGINLYELENQSNYSKEPKLKILLTNHHLLSYQGSELFTLQIAEYLVSQGHKVTIYTKYIDELKNVIEQEGIIVVTNLELIKTEKFDVAHVHHNILALDVRHYFHNLPIIFMSHGVIPFLEQPPAFDIGISKYIAVSEEVKENLISYDIDNNLIDIFHNKINPRIFKQTKPLNHKPEKALVISNKIDLNTENIIREACNLLNIQIEFIGKRFLSVPPERVVYKINESDIVFSLGRGVIETMMCGRIPIIFDSDGGDGIVNPENINILMKKNFSGRVNKKYFSVSELVEEIDKYDSTHGNVLKEFALKLFSTDTINELVKIYKEVISKNSSNEYSKIERKKVEFFVNATKEIIHYEQVKSDKRIFKLNLTRAEFLIQIGQLDKAKEQLLEMLVENESNIDVKNDLAVISILQENYQEAFTILKSILSINPFDEIALENFNYIKQEFPDFSEK